jgi:putative hydrolase of the HAD superfamily
MCMSTILVLDLDDTLYPEHTYVESGFKAVATWLNDRYGLESAYSESLMRDILLSDGRGAVFDRLLERHGLQTKQLVKACINVYRHHTPIIELYPAAKCLFERCKNPLYLVTDGQKVVQDKKIKALNIESFFKKIFITHRYGIKHSKPSLHCFERIREMETCVWNDMIYVGDNPAKDFVSLNAVGARTIRVLTGRHKDDLAKPGYDAMQAITNLNELEI